jgi:hypothetical protein
VKVQNLKNSNTAPSSKTFRDEQCVGVLQHNNRDGMSTLFAYILSFRITSVFRTSSKGPQ